MATTRKPIVLSLLITLIMSVSKQASPAPTYWYSFCPNTTMFANNSLYHSNLNAAFQSISSKATTPSGFYSTSAGFATDDKVYSLFLCRGDQNATSCQDCVTAATTADLPKKYCPNRKEALIWYDECMVRYSNESYFGRVDTTPMHFLTNTVNVTENITQFTEILGNITSKLAVQAANGGSEKKYATGMESLTSLELLYGLAQCTPDLNSSECYQCLRRAIEVLPLSTGARTLFPSCTVRYENYPFFNGAYSLSLSPPPAANNSSRGKNQISTRVTVAIVVPFGAITLALLVSCIYFVKKKSEKHEDCATGEDFTDVESLHYDLATLQTATDNFSHQNKLGEGGFGGVYKGTLPNGKEIAVKRLSKSSGQGAQEFKNEVLLVAKLQHKNLVRLLGFCLAGEEKLLMYEYVPNTSLDHFLFDPEKQEQLNWGQRYKIIAGIARGMLYLHQDSRLRIIHRDLKASNILLDTDMCPKISDFGMARIFRGDDQTKGNTSRVVGTYGYMSPEYAMQGQFSDKSDVYSFGVLILEIVSGKRNNCFYHAESDEDLLIYAWRLWREGFPLEFVDPKIVSTCSTHEVMRCIHLGLLCVQESIDKRPSMATVVLTIDSYSVTLPVPRQPGYFSQRKPDHIFCKATSSSPISIMSVNNSIISQLDPR